MKIRIFCTLYTLSDTNGTKYQKEKREFDFPDDVSLEAAYAEIWDKFGKLGRDNRPPCPGYPFERAPYKYAEIQGHQLVDPNRPKGEIETFKAYQADLLDPLTLRDCLKDSPKGNNCLRPMEIFLRQLFERHGSSPKGAGDRPRRQ